MDGYDMINRVLRDTFDKKTTSGKATASGKGKASDNATGSGRLRFSDVAAVLGPAPSFKWGKQNTSDSELDDCLIASMSISSIPKLANMTARALQKMAADLDEAFHMHAPLAKRRITVFRGIQDGLSDRIIAAKKGDVITEPAYMSTSLSPIIARKFSNHSTLTGEVGKVKCMIVIDVPQATPFILLDRLSGGEKDNAWEYEVLLPRGAQLVVVSVTRVADIDVDERIMDEGKKRDANMWLAVVRLQGFDKPSLPDDKFELPGVFEADIDYVGRMC
jgi:hypothetical protein